MAKTLGQVAEGQLVKLNESGKPVEFYVAKQNYESGLNGPGRTLLVRKNAYGKQQWNSTSLNTWSSSTLLSWLNNTYKSFLDSWVQNLIGSTTYYYTPGNGDWNVTSKSDSVFILSAAELGQSNSEAKPEGSVLPTSDMLQTGIICFTRTPYTGNNSSVWWLASKNYISATPCTSSINVVPVFTLPDNLYVSDDGTVTFSPPTSITVPSVAMQTQPITISWPSVNGADNYILQRKADSDEWAQVYAGALTSYTDTAGSWSSVQYQVCGVFDGVNGAFAQSEVITVVPASALVISGQDGNLGTITNDITYSVNTDTGNDITLVRTINGAQVATATVQNGFSYNIPVLDLPTGTNTIVITATVQTSSDPVTVTRTWTYTKAAASFPTSGGVAALSQDGQPIFPQTLAEAIKAIGGPWGGNLSTALDKLALAATYSKTPIPKYIEVKVDLSKVQAGDIVNLPVNGVMVPHIVVQVGNPDPSMYDSSCNGVWLLRQDIVENGQWNSSGVNTLSGSTIMTTMQGYVTDYDPTVQAAIKTVKIPYCVGGGDMTIKTLSNGLSCKMFPLNAYEIGTEEVSTIPLTGKKLDYFLSGNNAEGFAKRIFNYNGSPKDWLTRDPQPETSDRYIQIDYRGYAQVSLPMSTEPAKGYLPCFLLPTTFTATYYVDTDGNVHAEQEYTTAGDFYDLWGNVIPSVKIATGSYVGTGTYGSNNPNTLTFPFEPKVVFIQYTTINSTYDNIYRATIICSRKLFETVHHEINSSGTSADTKGGTCNLTTNGDTISWYVNRFVSGTGGSNAQMNSVNSIYNYVAIG